MIATRRLAAILAPDVAGYSQLMGAQEEGTHLHFGNLTSAARPPVNGFFGSELSRPIAVTLMPAIGATLSLARVPGKVGCPPFSEVRPDYAEPAAWPMRRCLAVDLAMPHNPALGIMC
jgi:hypothetical protein